jgi:hypothetical protein
LAGRLQSAAPAQRLGDRTPEEFARAIEDYFQNHELIDKYKQNLGKNIG